MRFAPKIAALIDAPNCSELSQLRLDTTYGDIHPPFALIALTICWIRCRETFIFKATWP